MRHLVATLRRGPVWIVVTLAFGLLTAPLLADTQQLVTSGTTGIRTPGSRPSATPWFDVFFQECRERRWVEGQNVTMMHRFANEHDERLPTLVAERIRLQDRNKRVAAFHTGPEALAATPGAERQATKPRVVAAYPLWKAAQVPPRTLPWHLLDQVTLAFLVPGRDGRLPDMHATTAKTLLAQARRHGVSTAIAIGGATGSQAFYALLFDPAARARFVTELDQVLATYAFDGVVLDMEYWPRPDVQDAAGGAAYLSLIQEVSARMQVRGGFVSVAVFGSAWFGKHYPAELVDVVDAFEIMAYDFSGSWSPAPGPHASYEQARSALTYWRGRVGKQRMRKAYLGIPFYGKCFPHSFTPGDPVQNLAYREILSRFPQAAASDTRRGDSCTVYYDGHATLQQKAALVKAYGLGGVSVWEITMDAPRGPERLLPALTSALR